MNRWLEIFLVAGTWLLSPAAYGQWMMPAEEGVTPGGSGWFVDGEDEPAGPDCSGYVQTNHTGDVSIEGTLSADRYMGRLFGELAGYMTQGENWWAIGDYTAVKGNLTNSFVMGRHAGVKSRGSARGHFDVYASEPSGSHSGTNDAVFLENGYLHLGRGAGAPGGAVGGELRGTWLYKGAEMDAGLLALEAAVDDLGEEQESRLARLFHYGDPDIEMTPEDAFSFNASTGEIIEYLGTNAVVVIPYAIGGVAVVGIQDTTGVLKQGFYENTVVVSITAPMSLTRIGAMAIRDCPNLVWVAFPGVTTIASYGLAFNPSLREVAAPRVATMGSYALRNSGLRHVEFMAAESVGYGAFQSSAKLVSVTLGPVSYAGDFAFAWCGMLEAVLWGGDEPSLATGPHTNNPPVFANSGKVRNVVLAEYADSWTNMFPRIGSYTRPVEVVGGFDEFLAGRRRVAGELDADELVSRGGMTLGGVRLDAWPELGSMAEEDVGGFVRTNHTGDVQINGALTAGAEDGSTGRLLQDNDAGIVYMWAANRITMEVGSGETSQAIVISPTNIVLEGEIAGMDPWQRAVPLVAVDGTVTVARAHGPSVAVTMTNDTVITFDLESYPDGGAATVTMGLDTGGFAAALATNTVAGSVSVDTNAVNCLQFIKGWKQDRFTVRVP